MCVVILEYIKGHFALERGQAGLPWGSNDWAKSWEKGSRNQLGERFRENSIQSSPLAGVSLVLLKKLKGRRNC